MSNLWWRGNQNTTQGALEAWKHLLSPLPVRPKPPVMSILEQKYCELGMPKKILVGQHDMNEMLQWMASRNPVIRKHAGANAVLSWRDCPIEIDPMLDVGEVIYEGCVLRSAVVGGAGPGGAGPDRMFPRLAQAPPACPPDKET